MAQVSNYLTNFSYVFNSGRSDNLNLVPTSTLMDIGSAWSLSTWNSTFTIYEGSIPASFRSYASITANFDSWGGFFGGSFNIGLSEFSDLLLFGTGNDQVVVKNDVWTPWGGDDVIWGGAGNDRVVFTTGTYSTYAYSYGSDANGSFVNITKPGLSGVLKAYGFETFYWSTSQQSVTFNNLIDTTPPSIIVSSNKTSLSQGQTATLTFTLSESSTNFVSSDISVSGGTLSSFSGSGANYSATFTPTVNTSTTGSVSVASNKFSDASGNYNNDGADSNNVVSISINTIDTTPPSILVGSNKTSLSQGQTATLTFTLSESSTDFVSSDISVSGGTLSNFSGSGANYSATFTPTVNTSTTGSVSVASNKFSDTSGNYNNDGVDSNNVVSISINTIDTTPPTILVSSNKTSLSQGQTATLTFTLSESSTDFVSSDISVSGGTLSNFSGSGANYSATFTPTVNTSTTGSVSVASNKFSDASGNFNNDGADSDNSIAMSVDTVVDTTYPSILVSSNKTSLSQGQTATLTFTLSESSTDFVSSDISVSGGTLSNFSGSGANYSATFTPTVNTSTTGSVSVASNKFSDASGNFNNDGADQDNATLINIDTVRPTIYVGSDVWRLYSGEVAIVRFTLSESSVNFTSSDIGVFGGTLSNFSGSGANYSATFTPTVNTSTTGSVSVASNKFSDASGNFNNDGADVNNEAVFSIYTIDLISPLISVVADKSSLTAGQTATITFTLSESSSDFTSSDISVSGGALSNFSGSGANYSATFTPTANSTSTGVVSVASNKFTDAAGNSNADGADSNNTLTMSVNTVVADTTAPTVAIESDKSSLTAGQTATITFTLSESSVNFASSDISVSGGALSNFSGSGANYSATFTPTANSTSTGVVSVASNKFTDAAGNSNADGADSNNTLMMSVNTVPVATITQVFDDGVAEGDGYGLYKTSKGSYVVDSEGLSLGGGTDSPVTLKVGAKGFVPKVAPSALLVYGDGFGVVAGSGAAWTEQKFGSNGVASGAALKLTLSDVLAKETFFNEDINGDGGIGDTIAQVFDNGSNEGDGYGLYKTSSGSYVVDSEGLSQGGGTDSPVTLKVGAKGFVPKVAPSALLVYGDGFGVVAGSGTAWTEQKFGSNGVASGAALKLTLSDVLAKETLFNEDINGGGIGDTIAQVFDGDGYPSVFMPYGLYKTASGSYVLDDAYKGNGEGLSQYSMRVMAGVKNWAPKGAIVGIAEKDSGYVEVLLRSGAAYTTQKIDPNSGQLAGPAAKLAVAQLAAREYYYEMDLNGNGQVELVGLAQPPADWVF